MDFAQLEDDVSDLVGRQPVADFGDSFDYFDGRFRVDGQGCQELHHPQQDGQVRRQMVTADARDRLQRIGSRHRQTGLVDRP